MMDSHIPPCCESRNYLSPVSDALHLFYGSTGCDTCPNGDQNVLNHTDGADHPLFSAYLKSPKGLTHGKRELYRGLITLIDDHAPAAAFVYTAGKAEFLGDEVDAVCGKVEKEKRIPVIPVHSEGYKGKRKAAERTACEALFRLMGTESIRGISPRSVNILGGFRNEEASRRLETRCRTMGIEVVSVIPGSPVTNIGRSHGAALNLVLTGGAMLQVAIMMEIEYGIPYLRFPEGESGHSVEAIHMLAPHFLRRS